MLCIREMRCRSANGIKSEKDDIDIVFIQLLGQKDAHCYDYINISSTYH